jgi:hypothetical protein
MTVPAKFQLASIATVITIAAITAGIAGNEVTIEMRLVPADRAADLDTTCHRKKS